MLPQSHVAYTLTLFRAGQQTSPTLRGVDYRWLALAAVGPDLLDKPVALLTYHRWAATKLLAHTAVVHLGLAGIILWKKPAWWPYLLAFNGHILADELWRYPQSFYWPLRGWHFHRWHRPGYDKKSWRDYWEALRGWPGPRLAEVLGLVMALLFVWSARLYEPRRLWALIRSGRV